MHSKSIFTSKIFWFNTVGNLLVVAGLFGFDLEIDDATKGQLAIGISSLVNVILRFATKSKVHVKASGLGAVPVLSLLGLAVLLPGCAALGSTDQAEAGLTRAVLEWCPAPAGTTDARQYLCGVEFTDGKDKKLVELHVKHPSGVQVDYKAEAVSGLKAIEARAAVDRAIAQAGVDVAPAVVDGIVKAITGL